MVEKQACAPYHICLKTNDLDAELKRLKPLGFKRISTPRTTHIHGRATRACFLFSATMGLVELIMECATDEQSQ